MGKGVRSGKTSIVCNSWAELLKQVISITMITIAQMEVRHCTWHFYTHTLLCHYHHPDRIFMLQMRKLSLKRARSHSKDVVVPNHFNELGRETRVNAHSNFPSFIHQNQLNPALITTYFLKGQVEKEKKCIKCLITTISFHTISPTIPHQDPRTEYFQSEQLFQDRCQACSVYSKRNT